MKASSTVAIAFVKSLPIPLHLLQDGTDTHDYLLSLK